MNPSASTVCPKVIENQERIADSERGVAMYEVQATAEMLLMTGQAKVAIAPESLGCSHLGLHIVQTG